MGTFKELRGITIREAFRKFHNDNPKIFQLFEHQVKRRISDWKAKRKPGSPRASASAIIEWMRWELPFRSNDENFRIDNNFKPYYPRLYVAKYPEDGGVFTFRKLRTEEFGPYLDVDINTGKWEFLPPSYDLSIMEAANAKTADQPTGIVNAKGHQLTIGGLPDPTLGPRPLKSKSGVYYENPMLRLGPGPDEYRCKHCVHLRINQPGSNKYFKCKLRGITSGPNTDHRANWPTCIKFELIPDTKL